MRVTVEISNRRYSVDLSAGIDISIPMTFGGDQPSAFGVSRAKTTPLELNDHVLATEKGGSCNVDVVTFIPHCHGTHTECVGHIVDDDVSITSILKPRLILAWLVSTTPRDQVITAADLRSACTEIPQETEALIVRTQPNGPDKLSRDYDQTPGPFFSREAIDYVLGAGIMHLVVDFPSIDRADDGGVMENHHRFWSVAPGERKIREDGASTRSVTEFAYVSDSVRDSASAGPYLLDLQLAPFTLDAAPSRPVLYKLQDHVR